MKKKSKKTIGFLKFIIRRRKKLNLLKVIKKTTFLILFIVIWLFVYGLGVAAKENKLVDYQIEEFKNRASTEYTEIMFTIRGEKQIRRFFSVSRETSYELKDSRSAFYDESRLFLGQKGDIFVTQDSPLPHIPIVHQFVTFYFGGHAALNNGENRFIEAVGFLTGEDTFFEVVLHPGNKPHDFALTASVSSTNYWLDPSFRSPGNVAYPYFGAMYRSEFIGLRVKYITEEQIEGAVDYADSLVNRNLYNLLFFLDTKYKYYCTDLVSRAYQHVMVEESKQRSFSQALNDDGFITSVNDLILSKETYILFFVEVVDGIVNIYYLEDV